MSKKQDQNNNSNAKEREDALKESDAFRKELEQALKKFHDPKWLGKKSPLAAPYFLGEYLLDGHAGVITPDKRGEVLRKLLRESIAELSQQEENGPFHALLLRLVYLTPKAKRPTTKIIAEEHLFTSRASFFSKHKPEAIEQLALVLNRRLKPALRLEWPLPQKRLVGQKERSKTCLAILKDRQSVGLVGPSGIGKTALGIQIAAQIKRPVFWLTFRLGLNDRIESLLFALGHFFARQGPSSLWSQLVATQTPLDINFALSLIRFDLERLPPLLLCFDEIDLLRPQELESHDRLVAFLESLKGLVPLLLIGQRLSLDVESLHHLSGLSLNSIQTMLKRAKVRLSAEETTQLQTYTQGNPRLLELFIALHRSGKPMKEWLTELERVPSLEFLFRRIWQGLTPQEQHVLTFLCAFGRPAPRDAWKEKGEAKALKQLIKQNLVQERAPGEVILLPAFRGVLYHSLSAEKREMVHQRAAMIRATRAEYTPAASHFLQIGESKLAFWLWHRHQEEELNQGQAKTALILFENMSPDQFSTEDQEMLFVLSNRLRKITGEYDDILKESEEKEFSHDSLKIEAIRIQGDIAELKQELQQAKEAYLAGLQTVEHLLSEKSRFHKNIGWVEKRENNLSVAWREALLADYEAQNLKGTVQEQMGNFTEARKYYANALALAKEAKFEYGYANTCNNLGRMFTTLLEIEEADEYLEKALQYFKPQGQLKNVASILANQAYLYIKTEDYARVIPVAKEALKLFTQLGQPLGRDIARFNLSEGYLGIGQLNEAEETAKPLIEAKNLTSWYVWRLLGDIRLAENEAQSAMIYQQKAIALAQKHNDQVLQAKARRSLAKAYRAQGNQKAAQIEFDHAIDLFEQLNMAQEIVETRREQI